MITTHPDKAAELRAALEAWWKDTGTGFPTQNPDFDEKTWWDTKEGARKARGKAK